jgi:preprotein translocase subunit SecG
MLAWKSTPRAAYLIDILAVMSSLYALYDLTDFLLIGARTDAAILAQITYIPAFVWAILWSGISLLVVYVAGKKALTRP